MSFPGIGTDGICRPLAPVVLLLALTVQSPGSSLRAHLQVPGPPQQRPVALTGCTVHPVGAPAIENATLLFSEGRIVALGRDVRPPADAKVIELPGKHVYPGLIDAVSVAGMLEVSAIRATVDVAEFGDVNPGVRAERAINPDSEHLPVIRANGIAIAGVQPTGGLISGLGAAVMLDGWSWEDMTLQAPVCLKIDWPAMNSDIGLLSEKEAAKRRAVIDERIEKLESAFRDARAYRKARRSALDGDSPMPERNLAWEAMIPVLERELPVWVEAERRREIEAAVDWASRENVRMVLVGGADAWQVAGLLKEKEIPVVISSVHRLPLRRDNSYDNPFTLASRLYEAGVEFCISGGRAPTGNERNLPYNAATSAAFGLPRAQALEAVTIRAARILGIEERAGSLEPGKDATLIVTDGDPLEVTTTVEKMWIQGRAVDLGNKQKSLYSKYIRKYEGHNPAEETGQF